MRVLLANHGSEEAAAPTAGLPKLPLPPASKCRIMSAVTCPAFAFERPPVPEFKSSVLEEVQRVVDRARAALAPRGLHTETDVAIGSPKDEIVRTAREWGADLVV